MSAELLSQPPSRAGRTILALVCLGLAAAAVLHERRRVNARASSEAFVKRFGLDLRRPDEVGAMRLEPEADLAAGIAVHAALADTVASRAAAQANPGSRNEEVAAARDLMLDASAWRPGWAYHRFLLGELLYEAGGRGQAPASEVWQTWATPLRLASAAAPGLDESWAALGGAYLDNWRGLSPAQRTEALPVLRQALHDPRFVSVRFLALAEAVGRDEAMGFLPEDSTLLAAAADALSSHGDLAAAAVLLEREDAAKRNARASELSRIEGRFKARDQSGLRSACAEWAAEHPVSGLDDPVGLSQAARLLELWPGDRGGPWDSDPRAELARFFLDGRETAVSAETLSRTLDALSDVPDHVTARVKLRAGDVAGAEDLANRPQNQGAPEWTLYYADRARVLLKQGRARDAMAALDLVSLATRGGCDALLARRDVARALRDQAELDLVGQKIAAMRSPVRWQEGTADGSKLSICVDPEQAAGVNLDLRIAAQGAAVVRYGWGAGRSGMLFLPGERVVSVPLAGLSGSRDLTVQSVAGAAIRASASFAASR